MGSGNSGNSRRKRSANQPAQKVNQPTQTAKPPAGNRRSEDDALGNKLKNNIPPPVNRPAKGKAAPPWAAIVCCMLLTAFLVTAAAYAYQMNELASDSIKFGQREAERQSKDQQSVESQLHHVQNLLTAIQATGPIRKKAPETNSQSGAGHTAPPDLGAAAGQLPSRETTTESSKIASLDNEKLVGDQKKNSLIVLSMFIEILLGLACGFLYMRSMLTGSAKASAADTVPSAIAGVAPGSIAAIAESAYSPPISQDGIPERYLGEPAKLPDLQSIQQEMRDLDIAFNNFLGALDLEAKQLDSMLQNNAKRIEAQYGSLSLWINKLAPETKIDPRNFVDRFVDVSENLQRQLQDLSKLRNDVKIVNENLALPRERMKKISQESALAPIQLQIESDIADIAGLQSQIKTIETDLYHKISTLNNEIADQKTEIGEYTRQFDTLTKTILDRSYEKRSKKIASEETQGILKIYEELTRLKRSLAVPVLNDMIVYLAAVERISKDVRRSYLELLEFPDAIPYVPAEISTALEFDLAGSFGNDQSISDLLYLSNVEEISDQNSKDIAEKLHALLLSKWSSVSAAFIAREFVTRFSVPVTQEQEEPFRTRLLHLRHELDALSANLQSIAETLGIIPHTHDLFGRLFDTRFQSADMAGTWESSREYAMFLSRQIAGGALMNNMIYEISYWGYEVSSSFTGQLIKSSVVVYDQSKKDRLSKPS